MRLQVHLLSPGWNFIRPKPVEILHMLSCVCCLNYPEFINAGTAVSQRHWFLVVISSLWIWQMFLFFCNDTWNRRGHQNITLSMKGIWHLTTMYANSFNKIHSINNGREMLWQQLCCQCVLVSMRSLIWLKQKSQRWN